MTLPSLAGQLRNWIALIVPQEATSHSSSDNSDKRLYLYGLRGILALSGVATVFVQTFIPALVWKATNGPAYQNILRIIASPLLWDEHLLSGFFLMLSGYTIALRFLGDPTPLAFAGSIIRRVIRFAPAVGLASGISSGIFSGMGTGYIQHFQEITSNNNIEAPRVPENVLVALNAIFNIFWVVRDYYDQAASHFWPTQTLWNLSLIFNQPWTTYFMMVILPYTRPGWHVGAVSLFALGSFWVCSWGWYSAAALLMADYTTNPYLRIQLEEGLTLSKKMSWSIPYTVVAGATFLVGFSMNYAWAALPQFYDRELVLHPFLDLSEQENVSEYAAAGPYPRLDNFLVITGILLLTETSVLVKRWLSWRPLVTLGKRSLSIFVVQSLVFWTLGIKLYIHLHDQRGVEPALAKFTVFAVGTIATGVCAEIFYRLVDSPSQWLASGVFAWLLR